MLKWKYGFRQRRTDSDSTLCLLSETVCEQYPIAQQTLFLPLCFHPDDNLPLAELAIQVHIFKTVPYLIILTFFFFFS